MYRNWLTALTLGALLALLPQGLPAQTEVQGAVEGVWNLEGSPYLAVGSIIIQDGCRLEIQPGVEVRFNPRAFLFVYGTLVAEGNEDNNILFTNDSNNPNVTWRGIRCINSEAGSIINYAVIENAFPDSVLRFNKGGGLSADEASFLTLQNTTIRHCRADMGGGVCVKNPNVLINNCIFENDTSRYAGGLQVEYFGDGGWFHISDNVFRNNRATDARAAVSIDAMSAYVDVSGNRFEDNSAVNEGGGLYIWRCRGGSVRNNVFVRNRSVSNAVLVIGANEGVLISGNRFIDNVAAGIIYVRLGQVASYGNVICQHVLQPANLISVADDCVFESYNDVIYGNFVGGESAVLSLGENSRGKLRNAIIYGNGLPEDPSLMKLDFNAALEILYSDIQGGWDGEGNFDQDPRFVNPDAFDFHLTDDSPCSDAGEPSGVYNDRDGSRNDMGIFGGVPVFPDRGDFDFGLQAVNVPQSIVWKWYNFSGEEAFIEEAFIDQDVFAIEPPDLEIQPLVVSVATLTYTADRPGEDEGNIDLNYIVGEREYIVDIPLRGSALNGVEGAVAGEWTVENSPYILIANCVVPEGEELLIEPGVEVRFLNQSQLIIHGALTAEGEEGDSIRFTNASDDRAEWGQGLCFDGAQSSCALAYVVVENQIALGNNNPGGALFHGGQYRVANSSIRNCQGPIGGVRAYGSDFVIRNCEIVGNCATSSVAGIIIGPGSKVIDCDVAGNIGTGGGWLGGLYAYGNDRGMDEDSLVITGCQICDNEGEGMYLGNSGCRYHIAYNVICGNTGDGLLFQTIGGNPLLSVDHTTVVGNGGCGACGEGCPDIIEVTNSTLWGNGLDFSAAWCFDYTIDIAFSDIETWEVGGDGAFRGGMLHENPRFFDAEGLIDGRPDFRLRADSPCIGAGSDGSDLGAYPYEGGDEAEIVLDLPAGWSSLGLRVCPETVNVRELCGGLVEDENLILVKNLNGQFYAPEWDFCNIPRWNYWEGYQIKLNRAGEFTERGLQVPVDEPIDLQEDWNLISYYSPEPMDVRDALASIEDQVILTKNYQGQFWAPEFGGDFEMQPGQGYWIKARRDVRFAYPVEAERVNRIGVENSWTRWQALKEDCGLDNTGRTMSLIVKYPKLDQPGHIIAQDDRGVSFGLGMCETDFSRIALYGDDPATPVQDGFAEGERIELFYVNPIGAASKVALIDGDIYYRTDGYEVLDALLQAKVEIPDCYCLNSVYPNPFNSSARISFGLPESGTISLKVFDLAGREVKTITSGRFSAGYHSVSCEAVDLPAGLYVLRLEHERGSARAKLVILK